MWLSIGSLSFQASWAAITIAFFLTTALLYLFKEKSFADYYSNAIFIFILTWKLSVILFQFKLSIQNPFTILYFNGGIRGYWLGIAASLIYLFIASKGKKQCPANININGLFQSWLMTVSIYELIMSIFQDHNWWFMVILILINMSFIVMTVLKSKQIQWQYQLVILFTSIQVLIYSIMNNLFSAPIITYILIAVLLSIIKRIRGVAN